MAGVKGRSGGARPGAGRPKKPPVLIDAPAAAANTQAVATSDPREFLRALMNDSALDAKLRLDAAKALMPYVHAKKGEAGKKELKQAEAEKVFGRFAAAAPPKLVAAGGKKV